MHAKLKKLIGMKINNFKELHIEVIFIIIAKKIYDIVYNITVQ